MRPSIPCRRSGFTLIELLVVITIIAILASIAVPTGNIVMRKARETQTRALLQGLVIGVKGYQTEYNRMPSLTATGGSGQQDVEPIELKSGNALLPILIIDTTTTPPAQNPRQITFFDPPVAKNNSAGYTGSGGGLFDSWGKPIWAQYDSNGDGVIQNPYQGGSEPDKLATPAISWSWGADKKDGTQDSTSKDDLKSWK